MKIQITEQAKPDKIIFPVLLESKDATVLILFTDTTTGIVIKHPFRNTADIYGDWAPADDSDFWQLSNASVTFSNF